MKVCFSYPVIPEEKLTLVVYYSPKRGEVSLRYKIRQENRFLKTEL